MSGPIGYLALWERQVPIRDGRLIQIPRSGPNGTPFFEGVIRFGDHPSLTDSVSKAQEGYKLMPTAFVNVLVSEDDKGIMLWGDISPKLPIDIGVMGLGGIWSLSGDWRRIGARLELVSVLLVKLPTSRPSFWSRVRELFCNGRRLS